MGLFQIGYGIYYIIYQVTSKHKNKEYNSMIISGMSFIILLDLLFILFFLAKLLILHTRLIFNNLTFYEHIKKKWKRAPGINPYNFFCGYHLGRLLCFSSNKSYLTVDNGQIDNNIVLTSNSNSIDNNNIKHILFVK